MPRKHLIASAINKKQQQQSKIALKCVREIKAAVKVGGTNPEANPRLKAAIARALQNNLTRDTIQKNISNSDKDNQILKEVTYEGYGPKGLAIIIKALTDNEQRTVSNIRGYFSKLHGELSKPNSVRVLFEEYGQIIIEKNDEITEDKILELTLDYNIVDIIQDESAFEILTLPVDFYNVKAKFDDANIKLLSSEIKLIPNSYVDITEQEDIALEKFIDSCDNDDDIQWVVHNAGEII